VFSSSGESVSLPCNNALSDCTSNTWNYNNNKHSETVELIAGGRKNNIERRERLSVGSDCSLNIKKVTHEDYGLYTCRQYVNGQQQGTDAPVNLHVLHSQCFCNFSNNTLKLTSVMKRVILLYFLFQSLHHPHRLRSDHQAL